MNVSVIIPHFNCSEYLEDALKSVSLQDYKIYEIIVVDDGSTSDHIKKITDLCNKFQAELICLEQNRGPSYARNEGFMASKGEWIQFLDADDMLAPGSINNRLRIAGDRSMIIGGIVMYVPYSAMPVNNIFQLLYWIVYSKDIIKSNIKSLMTFIKDKLHYRRGPLLYNGTRYLYAREIFNKYGLFDEEIRRGEDVEFIMRLTGKAEEFPTQCILFSYLYRQHANQITRSPKSIAENLRREYNFQQRCINGINKNNTRFP